ncbi:MAG: PAS domain-containing protein, partial [Bacteroidota bacterium]|nr:PAS domain-containing protein [Bacteroidota bacterium]
MKSKIQKRIITIGTIILVAIIATITIITFNQIKEVGNTTKSLVQTQDIILRSHQLTASTVHYEMNAEAFLEKEDKILESEIMLGKKKIDDLISFLTTQNVDNPKERIIIDSFVNAAKASVLFSGKLISAKKSGQLITTDKQALINECNTKVDSVINLANQLQSFENNQEQTQQSNTYKEIQNLKDSFYYRFGAIAILAIIVFRKLKMDLSNQQELNQQLKYMSGLINQTEDAIVSSRNDIIETWNKGAEKIYGYTKEEAVGKNVYDIVRSSLNESGRAVFLDFLKKEGKWHGEAVHTNKSGEKIHLLISITKIEDKNSSNFLVSIAKDITQKKKDEEKIVLFGAMLENSNDAIITIDSNLNINTWNNGAEKVYGYTAQEAIGKYEPDFLPVDPQTALDIAEEIKDYPTGGHWLGECLHKKKSGEQIDVSISITVFKNTATGSIEYVCIITDVTEKKKTEEKIKHLASIIQLSNDAIYTTDKDFIIKSWNKGAERMYGYTEKEMIGKKEYQILPAFQPVFSENNIQLYEEKGYFRTESSHRKKDGQIVIVSISVTYLKDENNHTIGFIIVINDVTEVKKLEGQLKNFNEKLEAEVIEKTKELNDVFGRVTDGFMALNNQKCFTYVNKKAGDILQKDHKDLIGKNIEKEFETIDENFFKAYNKVIKNQQHIHFEDFFESFNSWLEFDFYPSANGVSIYFKDISDQKKTQEDLIKLNYRFRTLASH